MRLVRALVYSALPASIPTGIIFVCAALWSASSIEFRFLSVTSALLDYDATMVPRGVFLYCLGIALSRYLSLPRAWLLAGLTSLAALLVTAGATIVTGR